MELLLDDKNFILAYASIGSFESGVEFQNSLPSNFFEEFKPAKFKLVGSEIVSNDEYVDKSNTRTFLPNDMNKNLSVLTKALLDLKNQNLQQQTLNAALTKQLMLLELERGK